MQRIRISSGRAAVRLALATITAGLTLSSGAAANPPLTDRFPVEATFDDPGLSASCGFPVSVTFEGTFSIRVFQANGGADAHEIDTQPATTLTYRSATGEISIPFASVLHADYPGGLVVGAPATLTITGTGAPYSLGSGRAVLDGVIVAVEDGFPITRFTELRSLSGNFTGPTERVCAALAG